MSLWWFNCLHESNSPDQQTDELETSCLMTEQISSNWRVYWNILLGNLAWLGRKLLLFPLVLTSSSQCLAFRHQHIPWKKDNTWRWLKLYCFFFLTNHDCEWTACFREMICLKKNLDFFFFFLIEAKAMLHNDIATISFFGCSSCKQDQY